MPGWEDAARSHELMPRTVDRDFWRTFLAERPDIMHRLLGDIYKATAENPEAIPSIDDLYHLVTPKFSTKPFTEAVWDLLGSRSVRWLATRMKISHVHVSRLMNGERKILVARDPAERMARLEDFAKALGVHASYFAEWRRLWILTIVDELLISEPGLSIGMFQRLRAHQPAAIGSRGPAYQSLNGRSRVASGGSTRVNRPRPHRQET